MINTFQLMELEGKLTEMLVCKAEDFFCRMNDFVYDEIRASQFGLLYTGNLRSVAYLDHDPS